MLFYLRELELISLCTKIDSTKEYKISQCLWSSGRLNWSIQNGTMGKHEEIVHFMPILAELIHGDLNGHLGIAFA